MVHSIRSLSANIADLLLDVVFLVDRRGIIVDVSAGCERMLGYRPTELIGQYMLDFVVPEDRAITCMESARVLAGQERVGFENRYLHKDGRRVDVMWSARWIADHGLRLGVARDISARKRAERRQAATYAISEAVYHTGDLAGLCGEIHAILDRLVGAPGMVVVSDPTPQHGFKVVYQRDHDPQTRLPSRACLARWRATATTPDSIAPDAVRHVGAGRLNTWLMIELGGPAGTIGALLLRDHAGTGYSPADRGLLRFVAAQVGLALERKRLHDDLMRSACLDELTGLPNRRLFFDRIRTAVARARRCHSRLGLLYVDVNDFKLVNDRYGHAAGDALLREVAARLVECARESDTVARLGGDEFVLLLEDLQAPEDAEHCADKICAALVRPVPTQCAPLRIGVSIGIGLFPDHADQVETLLMHADAHMYTRKRAHKCGESETGPLSGQT
ncbi:diguanylate cyclase [Telluria mixta]|uniref:Diguanylate cyclase n=1 Tax=Telluria mixta TaxID=34071 RepID=A0ABT2C8W4_9BURK|nr:diguanylate cyclase [Telluria mixta]MCS0633801.1 diguanylate cyclase [Telluria mixta]WEM95053.1 diguanylate cyclase [Telluria mixta]